MKQLGTLVLPDSIQWIDRDEWSPVQQAALQTLSGRTVLFPRPTLKGRPITLVAVDGVTWLTDIEVAALLTMASQPGGTFSLIWESDPVRTVAFRHHTPPAASFQTIYPFSPQHVGEIKLTEI
ncbi:MAG: hypothetical protein HQM00_05740 [Magnetococcales bacterium]|nr:hypothetical protein [Magnetococcales bacterium]